jgi:Inositol hexakisphosphate
MTGNIENLQARRDHCRYVGIPSSMPALPDDSLGYNALVYVSYPTYPPYFPTIQNFASPFCLAFLQASPQAAATPTTLRPHDDTIQPEEVVATRDGQVLLRHTILKSDHFPGCQNMRLTPLLEGAPNFRQVPDLPVYGVAIPTVAGVRLVLDTVGAWQGRRKVLWHNLREEPVIYCNGRPYVVREADKPFANLEYTGINGGRVEDMEARLKQDVLAEAARYGGAVLVAHEDDEFQVVEGWEPVSEVDVQTPLEVYEELKSEYTA